MFTSDKSHPTLKYFLISTLTGSYFEPDRPVCVTQVGYRLVALPERVFIRETKMQAFTGNKRLLER